MEELLKTLLAPLVKKPKSIRIDREEDQNNIKFTISVPRDDIAKVIGREGKMIKAIKNLLKIRAIKENVFVSVEIKEI